MSSRVKLLLGSLLGILVTAFAIRHFLYTYRDGNPNWFMIVMVCGMLLILYYTLIGGRRMDEDDEDYS